MHLIRRKKSTNLKELAEFLQTKVAGNGQMQAYPVVTPGCNKVGKSQHTIRHQQMIKLFH